MNVLLIVAVSVLGTSFVSGVLGMGGGMMLMGVYGVLLPVSAAMVLHGVTQFVSNGSRALLLRDAIAWRVLGPYTAGAMVAAGVATLVAWVPDRSIVFIALGVLPFVAFLPTGRRVDVARPIVGVVCGFAVTGAHLIAGVSGPLLDLFFINAKLDRRAVVATKAVTQTFAHLVKVVYYGAIVHTIDSALTPSMFVIAIAAAMIGTWLGQRVLHRITDRQFRTAGRVVLLVLGVVYLGRGLSLV